MPRPVKISTRSATFKAKYRGKSDADRKAIDKTLRLMVADLSYNSLRVKKMAGHKDIWEAHASESVVMTFDFESADTVRLRVCCNHDIYRNP